ncbi:MAG TPA: tRNA-(ms[2]io[6]A)-hydroxylase [Steroidobacteraceae bacterium]|nr:tRNA-(ms[2]io[6]A)-hydroxylase [Steroidobacteraceae bacterium]
MTGAESILAAPTPPEWLSGALAHWQDLLIDHANCEKKAASSALALMFAYPEDARLSVALARLAREELRHYEQVTRVMATLGVAFTRQRPGRYAQALRTELRRGEPHRKLDLLLANALIEARSAERFRLLAPHLSPPLAALYGELGVSEARHFELYVGFARAAAPSEWAARLAELARREAELVRLPERLVRFHSGPLVARAS